MRAVLSNGGPGDGAFGPDACRVTLRLTKGRFESASRGGFDGQSGRLGDRPASVPRSDRVVWTSAGLGGEETISSGLIRVGLPFEGELSADVDGPSGRIQLGPIPVRRSR